MKNDEIKAAQAVVSPRQVAALFVEDGGCYYGIAGVSRGLKRKTRDYIPGLGRAFAILRVSGGEKCGLASRLP